MTTVLADPAKMITKGAPHVIHNDDELEAYTNALFRLTALANLEIEGYEVFRVDRSFAERGESQELD